LEPRRRAALELGQRPQPRVQVELGWRRGRQNGSVGLDADAGGIARIQRPVVAEIADVVARVAGSWKAVEAEHALADDVHVLARNGRELAPERVERGPVETSCAGLETCRVDEMRGAELGDVNLQGRMLADEHARGPSVV